MAWIEVHQALRDHRKVLALAELLNMPEPHVVGHLVYLWLWAVDNTTDGTLPDSAAFIERMAGWRGRNGRLMKALLDANWLEQSKNRAGNSEIKIHDWEVYLGKLAHEREVAADKQRRYRERLKAEKSGGHRDGNVTVTDTQRARTALRSTVPNRTLPNTTEPLSLARTPAREDDDERETPLALGDGDDEGTPNAPSDLDEKRRRNGIRGACVDAWGKPDDAERGVWDSGITQLFDAEYTVQQVRDAIPLYEQRRPKAARTPSGLARNIRAVLSEARASPQAASIPKSSKPSEPTPEEMEAMNAKILDALSC